VRATGLLGLEVGGVDLLEADDGPKVIEVNASPGLEGIEASTGIDVAAAIVEHLERAVAEAGAVVLPAESSPRRSMRRAGAAFRVRPAAARPR
jgi:ribosomal protein S6--L-glutamate ligase